MTLSPQRLDKAAEALHCALAEAGLIRIQSWPPANPKLAETIKRAASATSSAYLGDMQIRAEHEAAFLVSLADSGITNDVQALLVNGSKREGIAPGALRKALGAALSAELTERDAG